MTYINRQNRIDRPERREGGLLLKGQLNTRSNNTKPLISVITVVRNGEKTIERTIQSVLNQTYIEIEYIIIDGCSTDETLSIIKKYENKITYWISEPDKGIYDAMNKGIKVSNGELIGLLNSGDLYAMYALENIVQIYNDSKQENEHLVLSGSMYWLDADGNKQFRIVPNYKTLQVNINITMPINHQATFISRSVYETLGLYDLTYKICGDYDFIFRAYQSDRVQFKFTDRDIAYVMMGGVSDRFMSLWSRSVEHFLIRKHHLHIIKNSIIFFQWLILAIMRHTVRNVLGKELMTKYYKIRHKQAI